MLYVTGSGIRGQSIAMLMTSNVNCNFQKKFKVVFMLNPVGKDLGDGEH